MMKPLFLEGKRQNKLQLKEILNAIQPDMIINLASLTNVDYCEQEPLLAREINIAGVQNI